MIGPRTEENGDGLDMHDGERGYGRGRGYGVYGVDWRYLEWIIYIYLYIFFLLSFLRNFLILFFCCHSLMWCYQRWKTNEGLSEVSLKKNIEAMFFVLFTARWKVHELVSACVRDRMSAHIY